MKSELKWGSDNIHSGSVTVILTESITFPRNVIICVGINTDFFSCIKNPKFCNIQTVSFTLSVHSDFKFKRIE
jgi:hypothetical protein